MLHFREVFGHFSKPEHYAAFPNTILWNFTFLCWEIPTTSSRDLMRDDDPGMERIANHLHACFAPEQVREEEAELEP